MKPLKRIMVIDDDEISNYIFAKLITISDFAKKIQSFEKGKDAIAYIKENANSPDRLPEVIFLDLILFDMDGWRFLDQYELLDPGIKDRMHLVILTTSLSEKDRKKAAEYPSVKKILMKPVTTNHLAEVLGDVKKKLKKGVF